MTERDVHPSPNSEPLDALSHRVSKALDEDARRRRWITRAFVVLAIVPAAAAVLVFMLGRSDVEQTRVLVREQTRDLETQISEKVSASVADEFEGARKVAGLLPELKSAVEVAPLVRENQRALSEYRTVVDSAVAHQRKLSQSVESATRDLARVPAELGELETRIQEASKRADTAKSRAAAVVEDMHSTAQALEARVAQSIESVQSEVRKTRADLVRQVDETVNALATSSTDTRRLEGIEKRLQSLTGQSKQIRALESQVARLPKQTTGTSDLQRKISALSRQLVSIDKRLATLERGGNSGSAALSRSMRSLQGKIDSMNRSISARLGGIEKRLATLERSRRAVIR